MEAQSPYEVLDLKALKCFWAMGRYSSLTQAGIELGISESAVSQRVKTLETYLHAKLYESLGGKVRLTAVGQRVMEMAVTLFEEIEGFQRELTGGGGGASGSLHVAAQDTILRYLVPSVVHAYTRRHPNVHLQLLTRSVDDTVRLVRQGEADVGFISRTLLPQSLAFHPWKTFEAYLVAPKGHPLFRGQRPTVRQLLNYETVARFPLIVPERDDPAYTRVGEGLAKEGFPYNVAFEVGNIETVKHYVTLGLGLAVISGICLVEEDKEKLEMLEVPAQYGGTTTYRVVLRKDKHRSAFLRAFLEEISPSVAKGLEVLR